MGEMLAVLKGLNVEQRQTLRGEAVRDGNALVLRNDPGPARRCALARRGILVDRMYSLRLTPMGEAIREALLEANPHG